jgi:uncharacterized membrane protein HdeD (DUF308 family)
MAIIFGLFALLWPGITVFALALLFGAYALIDGVGLLVGAFRHHRGQPVDQLHRLAHLVGGLLGIAAAALTILWPAITVLTLALLVGAWAVVTGIAEILAAIRLRKQIRGELLTAMAGITSVVAGALILWWPLSGALVLTVILGVYALVFGAVLLALALRLRRQARVTAAGSDRP